MKRPLILWTSLGSNLCILGVFKYFNFFADSLAVLLASLGLSASAPLLQIALPVGISFYTFQSMSYTIDVYRREYPPEYSPLVYFSYIAFFPQLVAGPIERASNLLPQFRCPRMVTASDMERALWIICSGAFYKLVVADTAALIAESAFHQNGSSPPLLVLGVLAFGVQIYGDFNGYSLIAKGVALLLGFHLQWNFNLPYHSSNISEFWRRWHISLSMWLRDYLYIPLGGNRGSRAMTFRNLIIVMGLGGLWHGASWNFVIWGLWHGFALSIYRLFKQAFPFFRAPKLLGWTLTMSVVFIGWFLFRAQDLSIVRAVFALPNTWGFDLALVGWSLLLFTVSLPVILIETWQYQQNDLDAPMKFTRWTRATLQTAMILSCIYFSTHESTTFIYFQF